MSASGAYRLRDRAEGAAFSLAWSAALLRARRRLADVVLSRALHGCVEVIYRDGEPWGERHRFDNRLTMAVLNWLHKVAEAGDDESRAARFVEQEFDQFVEIVSAGGDGAAAFIAARELAEMPLCRNDAARNLARLESYRRHGDGLAEEIAGAEDALPGSSDAAQTPVDQADATNAGARPASEDVEIEDVPAPGGDTPRLIVTWRARPGGEEKPDE